MLDREGAWVDYTCADLLRVIRDYSILEWGDGYRFYITKSDWVNLREVLTYMMWRYQIGTECIFGTRPANVQKALDDLIARHTNGDKK
jgi:hypothetical protein